MSVIRITVGNATVEVDSYADSYADGMTSPGWAINDLIDAAARAADAARDRRADTLRLLARGEM